MISPWHCCWKGVVFAVWTVHCKPKNVSFKCPKWRKCCKTIPTSSLIASLNWDSYIIPRTKTNKQFCGLKPQSECGNVVLLSAVFPVINRVIIWILFRANRNNYKGYSLESRLHFRIHATLSQLKAPTEETGPEADYGEMVMSGLDCEFQQLQTSSADESKRTTKL